MQVHFVGAPKIIKMWEGWKGNHKCISSHFWRLILENTIVETPMPRVRIGMRPSCMMTSWHWSIPRAASRIFETGADNETGEDPFAVHRLRRLLCLWTALVSLRLRFGMVRYFKLICLSMRQYSWHLHLNFMPPPIIHSDEHQTSSLINSPVNGIIASFSMVKY